MMKRLIAAVLLFAATAAAAAPRLAVVVVVDQMRADYLERDPGFGGGFARLAREGAVFSDARHWHVPTETGPGHAALSTGRGPATHGIVSNDWYDRRAWAETYCVADEPYGTGPGHLDGPTLADVAKTVDSRARVFSVSGKDRAAVLLGGRRPDLALWLDRTNGVFTTSPYYRRPAWLAEFNAELIKSGLLPKTGGKLSPETLASPAVDEATARLVESLEKYENLGRGPATDLLLVSFSATDTVGHRYGTEAPEMKAQLRALDAVLGRLLARWEKVSGGALVAALSADHGAIPSPEDPSGKAMGVRRFDWDAFGRSLEGALQKLRPAGEKWILSNQTPNLYLNRGLAARLGLAWEPFLRDAAAALSRVDGVGRVVVASSVPEMDAKDPLARALKLSYRPDRSGDLYLIVAEKVLLHDQPTGTSHGTPWDYDARVPLVFWGAGVKAARVSSPASTMDLAPTMARLMGFEYPAGDGGAARAEVAPKAR